MKVSETTFIAGDTQDLTGQDKSKHEIRADTRESQSPPPQWTPPCAQTSGQKHLSPCPLGVPRQSSALTPSASAQKKTLANWHAPSTSMRRARAEHAPCMRRACAVHAPSLRRARAGHAPSKRRACAEYRPSMRRACAVHIRARPSTPRAHHSTRAPF